MAGSLYIIALEDQHVVARRNTLTHNNAHAQVWLDAWTGSIVFSDSLVAAVHDLGDPTVYDRDYESYGEALAAEVATIEAGSGLYIAAVRISTGERAR